MPRRKRAEGAGAGCAAAGATKMRLLSLSSRELDDNSMDDGALDADLEDYGSPVGAGSPHAQHPLQRNAANARERARMRVLSRAFCRLKTTLPWVPADTKLSKLDTLRLATSYIAHLRDVLLLPAGEATAGAHPTTNNPLNLAYRPTNIICLAISQLTDISPYSSPRPDSFLPCDTHVFTLRGPSPSPSRVGRLGPARPCPARSPGYREVPRASRCGQTGRAGVAGPGAGPGSSGSSSSASSSSPGPAPDGRDEDEHGLEHEQGDEQRRLSGGRLVDLQQLQQLQQLPQHCHGYQPQADYHPFLQRYVDSSGMAAL
ncbi:Transcription factor 21 [Frankliniella fusca]|uniref:Transcription factor 21 n=1 Tax=Frankliniella fusca TaxID=407009 RepID=A0AAE1H3F4_9NEOP|nr:Transcription factor 21 [Frankliniella fusca]